MSASKDSQLLAPEEAQRTILDQIRPLGTERVSLLDALNRVLAAELCARYDNPPYTNSAMDGYALRYRDIAGASSDEPARLEMIEEIPAGSLGRKKVEAGQTSRIMTGAPLPAGADTVVPVENTRAAGTRIEIFDPGEIGAHIRLRGEDLQRGQALVSAGTCCTPGEVAALAAQQRSYVPVYRRPGVAILSTGDELREIDVPLEPGSIVNSNTYALAALARACGAEPIMQPIVPDHKQAIRQAVEEALNADFILSSGGVSVGEYDYIKEVLGAMGAQTLVRGVAMKPGKPLFFCTLGGTPYFGLPGNPVSGLMGFLQFVRPALRKAGGHPEGEWLLPEARARLQSRVHNEGGRRQYLRAHLRYAGDGLRAEVFAGQGSHMLSSLLGTNGLVVLEPEEERGRGEEVRVQITGRVF